MGHHKVYVAEPTLDEFHCDNSFVRMVMGPIGSGKSSACVNEVVRRITEQAPGPDGVRRSRWAVVRTTYPELRTTTIKTWQDWVPDAWCPIIFSAPIEGRFQIRLADGTRVESEIFFFPLTREQDVRKLLSLELTGAWLNEVREMPKVLVDAVTSRLGRYPAKDQGGPSWTGLIADTNPPHTRHWYYEMAEQLKPDDWKFYRQPGALMIQEGKYVPNPYAEGARHQPLGFRYWLQQLSGKTSEWIKSYVLGEYANVFDGRAVYENNFLDALHLSPRPLGVYRGLPIILGWDFGLTPACVIAQLSPSGRLQVLREFTSQDMGLKQFVKSVVAPVLVNEFSGMRRLSFCDPAGAQRSQADEQTCIGMLKQLGIETEAASTNDFVVRREAVLEWLNRMAGTQSAFVLDPSCEMLRAGFLGGYHYKRILGGGEMTYRESPNKNEYSHVHDALQYLCMHASTSALVALGKPQPPPQQSTWAARTR